MAYQIGPIGCSDRAAHTVDCLASPRSGRDHAGWRRLGLAAAVSSASVLSLGSPQLATADPQAPPATADTRPNILWIVMDDMRYDAMGCSGRFDWVQTPNMDRLASQGVRFTQAYCNSPVCGPSRHSMFTGAYPRQTGCYGFEANAADHPTAKPLFTDLLKESGYRIAAFGKEETLRVAKTDRGAKTDKGYAFYDFGHDASKRRGTYQRDGQIEANPSEFFDKVNEEELGVIRNPGKPPIIIAGTNPRPADQTLDAHVTNDAIAWTQKQQQSTDPYLLFVGYRIPHTPVLPPKPFDTMYDPAEMPIPDMSRIDAERLPKQLQIARQHSPFHELSEAQLRKVWAHYFAWTSYGDHLLGSLIDEFQKNSGDRPWLIVFVSDHGFLLGEHGMGQKFCFFDIVFRVPLIVASSDGRFSGGVVSDKLVELVDLAPTMLTAGGVTPPAHMHGRDLHATLTGASPPRHHVIGDTYHMIRRAAIRADLDGRSWIFSMRNRPDNFVMGEDIDWAARQSLTDVDATLYDLDQDPDELHNLASDAAHADVAETLRRMLESRIFADRVEVDWYEISGYGATYGQAWTKVMKQREREEEEKAKRQQSRNDNDGSFSQKLVAPAVARSR